MTKQKPVAWSYSWAFGEVLTRHNPTARAAKDHLRDIRPLYEHPAPPTEQKPVAWIYSYFSESMGRWLRDCGERDPANYDMLIRNVRPLYEHPASAVGLAGSATSQVAQPATDPAVEAARRKALKFLLREMAMSEGSPDTARMELDFGVLRDLVGQPRKDPLSGKREPDLKVSATMHETRVNTADLAKQAHDEIAGTTAMPSWAFQSVDKMAQTLQAAAGGPAKPRWCAMSDEERQWWRDEARRFIERIAKMV